MNDTISIKKTGKQIVIFLLFAVLIVWVLLKGQDIGTIMETALSAQVPFVLLGLLLAEIFHISEGMNLRILLKTMGHKVSFWHGMKYAYTGFLFSSITPSSTGGQPMQLYAMKKDGIELSHGSLALLLELTSFQLAAFLFEIAAVIVLPFMGVSLSGFMKTLCVAGFVLNVLFIAFLITVVFTKGLSRRLFEIVKKILYKLSFLSPEKKARYIQKMEEGLEEFHACALVMKEHKKTAAAVMAISAIQILCWFSIPYVVYLALGNLGVAYGHILTLQILLFMVSSLLPLPGAMGISEIAFLQLFSGIYAKAGITAAVLLSRGISFYFLLLFSAVMLVVLKVYGKKQNSYTFFEKNP